MDGRGRCLDNVFVERLWRSVKYEDIYLRCYEVVPELHGGLGRYFGFYNEERPHQSLEYRTPGQVYRTSEGSIRRSCTGGNVVDPKNGFHTGSSSLLPGPEALREVP